MNSDELKRVTAILSAWEGRAARVIYHHTERDGKLLRKPLTTRSYSVTSGGLLIFSGGCLSVQIADVQSLSILPCYDLRSHSDLLQLTIVVSDYENERYPHE